MDFSSYSSLNARDSWTNTPTERGSANQAPVTAKLQLPWQNNNFHGTTSGPGYSGPAIECIGGVSDSSSALSLLSNQSWGSRVRPSSLGVNHNFLDPSGSAMVQPSVNHGSTIGQFGWGFKDNQPNSGLHGMAPDLGLGQAASNPGNSQYNGELGLAQPSEGQFHELDYSRGYDSSVQHMHWSL